MRLKLCIVMWLLDYNSAIVCVAVVRVWYVVPQPFTSMFIVLRVHTPPAYEGPIVQHLKVDDWYMLGRMKDGSISQPLFSSLDAYWPAIQVGM